VVVYFKIGMFEVEIVSFTALIFASRVEGWFLFLVGGRKVLARSLSRQQYCWICDFRSNNWFESLGSI